MSETTEKKTVAPRQTQVSNELLKAAKAGQHAASEAVRKFISTLDKAIGERREAVQKDAAVLSLRKTIVDAALDLADELNTTQYEFFRNVVRAADQALSNKPAE